MNYELRIMNYTKTSTRTITLPDPAGHFTAWLGRPLSRVEATVIRQLEYLRYRRLPVKLLINDPDAESNRIPLLLVTYFRYLDEHLHLPSFQAVADRTKSHAQLLTRRLPKAKLYSGFAPNSLRGATANHLLILNAHTYPHARIPSSLCSLRTAVAASQGLAQARRAQGYDGRGIHPTDKGNPMYEPERLAATSASATSHRQINLINPINQTLSKSVHYSLFSINSSLRHSGAIPHYKRLFEAALPLTSPAPNSILIIHGTAVDPRNYFTNQFHHHLTTDDTPILTLDLTGPLAPQAELTYTLPLTIYLPDSGGAPPCAPPGGPPGPPNKKWRAITPLSIARATVALNEAA